MASGNKAKGPFTFKQFVVHHDRCAMKVGTDAVLLGAWTRVHQDTNTVLDVGAGSGVIALMMAQRTNPNAKIDAIEVADPEFHQALENSTRSPWPDKIHIMNCALQEYFPDRTYDLIVCNPPFFVDSLLPADQGRRTARHSELLSHLELVQAANRLLKPEGSFSIILPTEEGNIFQSTARDSGLFPGRRLKVFSRKGKPQERWLLELGRKNSPVVDETLVLHAEGDLRSGDYSRLTADFYL